MAKVSKRTAMVRGRVGKDIYKGQNKQQLILEYSPRGEPPGEREKESIEKLSKYGERFGLLPKPIQNLWEKGAKKFSAPPHIHEKKQDYRKTYGGLKITHHDHSYEGETFYVACNAWRDKAGMEIPADFPPAIDKIAYPFAAEIIDWKWEKPRVGLLISIPRQPGIYLRHWELTEMAVIARATFGGKKKYADFIKDGVKKWKATSQFRARDQVVARTRIEKTPCDVWLWFDKVHVGPTLGDIDVPLDRLGKGVMTICANVIGAPNCYWGKSDMYPELKGEWHLLTPAELEQFRKEGKLKNGPLVDATAEEDFNGGMLSGALLSLESNYVKLDLNREAVPTMLKKSGAFFKSLNQKKSQNK